MKIWNLFKKAEKRSIDFESIFGQSRNLSQAGANVTPQNSLNITAVWSAVDMISNSVAKLPISVYKTTGDVLTEDKGNKIYKCINNPNQYVNKFDFYKTMVTNLLLWGNAYALIDNVTDPARPILTILPPTHVSVVKNPLSDRIDYQIGVNSKAYKVNYENIIHFKRTSLDGYLGISPIIQCREVLGIANNATNFITSYYEDALNIGGVIQYSGNLDSKAEKALVDKLKSFGVGARGNKATGSLIPLPIGLEFKQNTHQKIIDMDFVNTQKFYSIEEVARLFNIPPIMLGHTAGTSSYGTVEQLNLMYFKQCVSPLLSSIENELETKLFNVQGVFNVVFDTSQELRGDTQARTQYYEKLMALGAITPNEIRVAEGYRPSDKPAMDKTYMTLNNSPIDTIAEYQSGKAGATPAEPAKENTEDSDVKAL